MIPHKSKLVIPSAARDLASRQSDRPLIRYSRSLAALGMTAWLAACGGAGTSNTTATASGDSAFKSLAAQVLADTYKRHPSQATLLGIHTYDAKLDDYAAPSFEAEAAMDSGFKAQLVAMDTSKLSLEQQLDRQQLIHAMDANVLANRVIKNWARNPDTYSSGITNAAYVVMERAYAPASQRLAALVAREKAMPGALAEARKNLVSPPKIFTQIAIEQIDGNISFFKNDVPAAFKDVTDKTLLADFKTSNDAVMKALADYKTFLQKELLPVSKGEYGLGSDVYVKALSANEMVDVPLKQLLQIAEADRAKNESAFQATAKQIDSTKPADAVLASLQNDHPKPNQLLAATQGMLDSLRQFIVDHHIVTIPPSEPARVEETPPFMRSTTSASMDTPGPFETAKLQGYYNMTLPDPRAPRPSRRAKSWYYAATLTSRARGVSGALHPVLYAASFYRCGRCSARTRTQLHTSR